MATISKRRRKDGSLAWRAVIRMRGSIPYYKSRTFNSRDVAHQWVKQEEARLDRPGERERAQYAGLTLGRVLERYQAAYGAEWGRTKTHHIGYLTRQPVAQIPVLALTTQDLVSHIMRRREDGAGPATAGNDLIWIKAGLKYARAALGVPVGLSALEDARHFLAAERVIARSRKRQRRPTADELAALHDWFAWAESKPRPLRVPMRELVQFAIASTRRQAEITRLLSADNDPATQTGWVRDAKHPRLKKGNHQQFKYTPQAWEIVQRQPGGDRIFPYNPKTVGAYFTRACHILGIPNLHFHDLRHEGTSRLFEAGYSITEVQRFTLHENWNTLKGYTHLKPSDVVIRSGLN